MGKIVRKEIEYSGGSDAIEITQAEYDQLSPEAKNNNMTYYITDADSNSTAAEIEYNDGTVKDALDELNVGLDNKENKFKHKTITGVTDTIGNIPILDNQDNMVLSAAVVSGEDVMAYPWYHRPSQKWYCHVMPTDGSRNVTETQLTIYFIYI